MLATLVGENGHQHNLEPSRKGAELAMAHGHVVAYERCQWAGQGPLANAMGGGADGRQHASGESV